MKLNDLNVGQSFKNYKELCNYLNQPVLTSNSKKAQIKEWKRYFAYVKDGQRITITKINNPPLNKYDGRINNGRGFYQKLITDIFLDHIKSIIYKDNIEINAKLELNLTLNQTIILCGMANQKYFDAKFLRELKNMGYDKYSINNFLSRTKSKFIKVIENALFAMQKKGIISFEKCYMIVKANKTYKAGICDVNKIIDIENEVLEEMGFKSLSNVFSAFKSRQYYKKLKMLINYKYGWDYFYRSYCVKVSGDNRVNNNKYSANTYQENCIELNKRLIKFFDLQAEKNLLKETNSFTLPPNYLDEQKELSKCLLDISKNNKTSDFQKTAK